MVLPKKIAIVGFGHIGSVIGASLANKGNKIYAIDNDKNKIQNFQKNRFNIDEPSLKRLLKINKKKIFFTNKYKYLSEVEMCIITVGTPLNKNQHPNFDDLDSCLKKVKKHINKASLIELKSTIQPGTTRSLVNKIIGINNSLKISYSPERLAEGSAISDFENNPVIIGTIKNDYQKYFEKFWIKLGFKVIKVSSPEVAEFSKLCDNLWIDLNIALANELAILADKCSINIDILDVINTANSLKKGSSNVNILLPSFGVGGYCLPKDPWFLDSFGKKNNFQMFLPKISRSINDNIPNYWAERLSNYLKKKKLEKKKIKIAILGYAFKSNTGDCRNTPVKDFVSALYLKGLKNFYLFDPLVSRNENISQYIKRVNNPQKAIKDANIIAFLCGHDCFSSIDEKMIGKLAKPKSLVFDGRMYFDKIKIENLKKRNLEYMGIGRN